MMGIRVYVQKLKLEKQKISELKNMILSKIEDDHKVQIIASYSFAGIAILIICIYISAFILHDFLKLFYKKYFKKNNKVKKAKNNSPYEYVVQMVRLSNSSEESSELKLNIRIKSLSDVNN